ncbi:hypothetical protein T552_03128 [Pneumocystis carinii B80]|uniref:Non-structural maintenance of chromosomes element 4 n=1 Tax=Pneumocystis carinii (strain B80) TaxID=1408658 RepID=A0A0W4ZBQ6_PNEC8|nr:hypothetical protein T552_03128 [Pneumocystis carinii B80]KTW25855.1 hypothetical protein T552_03128 [Pneumocystis carinii B80]
MVLKHSEINKINKSLKKEVLISKKRVPLRLDNENYCSDEDVDSRQALRQEYRKLIKMTDEKKQDYIKRGDDGLINTIRMADQLFEKVKRPQEAALDSQLLVQTVGIVNTKAKRLKLGDLLFDMDLYIVKLLSFIKTDKDCHMNEDSGIDWMKIGRLAMLCNKRPPTINFMLGPLSVERKERKVTRQERFHKNKEDLVQPEEIKDGDILPQDNTTPKNVMNIDNYLKRHSPIGLFEFVINPESFCQTVENMFYLTFLIREGKASLVKGKNDILILESKNMSSSEEQAQGNKKQAVMYIDMKIWRDAIEALDITKSIISTR